MALHVVGIRLAFSFTWAKSLFNLHAVSSTLFQGIQTTHETASTAQVCLSWLHVQVLIDFICKEIITELSAVYSMVWKGSNKKTLLINLDADCISGYPTQKWSRFGLWRFSFVYVCMSGWYHFRWYVQSRAIHKINVHSILLVLISIVTCRQILPLKVERIWR